LPKKWGEFCPQTETCRGESLPGIGRKRADMFREFTTEVPVFAGADFNILDFGAVAGGRVSCTEAFARAIEKASEKGEESSFQTGSF
jgi:hypothetical protein